MPLDPYHPAVRVHLHPGSSRDPIPPAILPTWIDEIAALRGSMMLLPRKDADARLLDIMTREPTSVITLASKMNLSEYTVRHQLLRLLDKGRVARIKEASNWMYFLKEDKS